MLAIGRIGRPPIPAMGIRGGRATCGGWVPPGDHAAAHRYDCRLRTPSHDGAGAFLSTPAGHCSATRTGGRGNGSTVGSRRQAADHPGGRCCPALSALAKGSRRYAHPGPPCIRAAPRSCSPGGAQPAGRPASTSTAIGREGRCCALAGPGPGRGSDRGVDGWHAPAPRGARGDRPADRGGVDPGAGDRHADHARSDRDRHPGPPSTAAAPGLAPPRPYSHSRSSSGAGSACSTLIFLRPAFPAPAPAPAERCIP